MMDNLMIGQATACGTAEATRTCKEDPKKIENAAQQFESLLLAQILKSLREAGSGGWLGGGEDQAGAPAMELAEEQFAQALSTQGGLGLAKMISDDLKRTR